MKFRTVTYLVKIKAASKAAFIVKKDLTRGGIRTPVANVVAPILRELILVVF